MAYTLKPDFGGYTVAILASIMLITSNTSVGISREGIHILYGKGSLVKRVKWDKVDHAELINKQSRTRLKVTLKSNSSFFPKPKIQHFYPIQDYDAIYDLFEEKKIRFDI
ncbi:hypothetical protein [Pelagirhabdus alkalitolerans]|nr:hypothetical protein [Pelagirhabdus alkalitolerans]